MENENINLNVLYEIALFQLNEFETDKIIKNVLPLYLRKLNCFVTSIITNFDEIHVVPYIFKNSNTCLYIKGELFNKLKIEDKNYYEFEYEQDVYYCFKLVSFGWLILGKKQKFTVPVKNELKRIITQLGKQLNQSKEDAKLKLFQSLIDNSADAIQVSDIEGKLLYINKESAKRIGIPQDLKQDYYVSDFENKFKTKTDWYDHVNELKQKNTLIIEGENKSLENDKTIPVEVTVNYTEIKNQGYVIANSRDITNRKEIQNLLLNTNNKLQSILNEMSDVVWSATLPELKFLFYTPSAEKLFGTKIDSYLTHKNWWKKAIYKDDIGIIKTIIKQLNKYGEFSVKHRIITFNGSIKWVQHKGKIIFNNENKPIRIDCVLVDKSKEINTEEDLEKEVNLQKILIYIFSTFINADLSVIEDKINHSLKILGEFVGADRAYIFKYDFDNMTTSNTYEWCNKGVSAEILNLQNVPIDAITEWIDKHQLGEEFFIPDLAELDKNIHSNLIEILEPQGIKSLITIPMLDNGELKGFIGFDYVKKIHNYSDKEKKILHLFSQMLLNVQNRQKWIDKILTQEEKYRNIIANMNLGLIEVDNKDNIIFANQSFCEMSGYTINELIGQNATTLFIQEDEKAVLKSKFTLREKGVSDSFEIKSKNKKGENLWWLISGAPNFDESGKLIGSIGIHLDITNQKKLEDELNKAKIIAEQSSIAKENFFASVSHEIRTPLNAIIGIGKLLSKLELTSLQKTYIDSINNAGEHLLAIVTDILDLSKINAGKLTIDKVKFNLHKAIKDTILLLQHKANEKGLIIKVNYDKKISENLLGDLTRINQIIFNLLSNAIKFSEKGEIKINCKVLKTKSNSQLIKIEIIDEGIGIDKQFLTSIFENYTQETSSKTIKEKGTGLGMSITKQLITLMNGEIFVDSIKGKGTTFTINIPFSIDLNIIEKNTIKKSKNKFAAIKNKKILIVEDNELNILLASTILKNHGAIVQVALDGNLAINAIDKNDYFDIILMDIQMPNMNGLDATKIIRSKAIDIPIIALTANAMIGESSKYFEVGIDDYISKPYEEFDLLNIVSYWIEKGKSSFINKKEPPLYNLAQLESIDTGNKAFKSQMINLFIEQMNEYLPALSNAMKNLDYEKIYIVAHKMKSTIDYIGINSISKEIREIEHFANEKSSNVSIYFPKVLKVINTVVEQIKEEL